MSNHGEDLSQFDISVEVRTGLLNPSLSLLEVPELLRFPLWFFSGKGQARSRSNSLRAFQDAPQLRVSDKERRAHSIDHQKLSAA